MNYIGSSTLKKSDKKVVTQIWSLPVPSLMDAVRIFSKSLVANRQRKSKQAKLYSTQVTYGISDICNLVLVT